MNAIVLSPETIAALQEKHRQVAASSLGVNLDPAQQELGRALEHPVAYKSCVACPDCGGEVDVRTARAI
jgi:hypothetical protein